jgi:lysophospholipase L1-like esterase
MRDGRLVLTLKVVALANASLAILINPWTARLFSKGKPVDAERITRIEWVQAGFLGMSLFFFLTMYLVKTRVPPGKRIRLVPTFLFLAMVNLGLVAEFGVLPKYGANYAGYRPGKGFDVPLALPDKSFGHVLNPAHTETCHVNELGFRGGEPSIDKSAFRILCIGDSITFGWKLKDNETYPVRLQEALTREFPNQSVQVFNGGVPGYCSQQLPGVIAKLAPVLEPHLILVCIGWNDLSYSYNNRWHEQIALSNPFKTKFEPAISRAAKHFLSKRTLSASPFRTDPDPKALEWMKRNLNLIQDVAGKHQAKLVFLNLPTVVSTGPMSPAEIHKAEFYKEKQKAISDYTETIRRFCTMNSISFIEKVFPAEETAKGMYFMDNCHFSPEGSIEAVNRIIAELKPLPFSLRE